MTSHNVNLPKPLAHPSRPASVTRAIWATGSGGLLITLTLLFVASVAPIRVAAQTSALPFTLQWSSFETELTRSIAWGDYDGDGDLDLAVGNDGQRNQLYRNNGGELTASAVWSSAESDNTTSVAWGDFDGDGDLDLVAGNDGQPIRLYRNEDGSLTPYGIWSPDITDNTWSVAWGDYDGDGYLDLAVGNSGQPNRLYRNVSGVLATTPIWSAAITETTHSVAWGDYDGDGYLDLAVGNGGEFFDGQRNRLYRNTGGMLTTTPVYTSSEADNTWSVAWADYDSDGDLDLAAGNWTQPNRLYRNEAGVLTENAVWSSSEPSFGYPKLTRSVAWGDYDGDGDPDLVAVNHSQPSLLYGNNSGSLLPVAIWSSVEADDNASVAWGDVDGDGDLDLATGTWGDLPNRLYRNEVGVLGAGLVWSSVESNSTESVAWGDIDNDGDLDLAIGNGDFVYGGQPNFVHINYGGALASSAAWTSSESDLTTSVAWGDYDRDGDLDLAAGNYEGYTRLYRNDGGTLTSSSVWSSAEINRARSVAWGDYDIDGDLDLIVGNDPQPNRLYCNENGTLNADACWSSIEWDYTTSVAWGDYDSDGDLDLAAGQYGWGGQPNRLYRNDNGQLTASAVWSSSEADNTMSVAWGDYDDDGDLDLAVGNDGQPIRLYRNDNGQLTSSAVWSAGVADRTHSVAWGDIDADGDLDLAVGNSVQTSRLYRNDGGVLTPSAVWSSSLPRLTRSVAWGDYDGDGDLDLATGNSANTPNDLYRNNRDLRLGLTPTPIIRVTRPAPPADADFYSTPEIWSGPIIPITYSLSHPQSDPVRLIRAFYSPDGGGRWLPAMAARGTITKNLSPGTYRYSWDVFASGLLGQSDNVVFRIEAVPAIVNKPNSTPGPYLYGSYASSTFPFRVRGTQVRVLNGTAPISNALVFRLPAGQTGGAQPLADNTGRSFRSDGQGYLQGRGQLNLGDQLVALLPIAATDSYTLYHTSAAPTLTGLNAFTVTQAGVQTLTVSAANPLLVFDLDVSLEWDASNDPGFLTQLQQNLAKTSTALYDWTDGQVALGQVTVYQDKQHWDDADVRVFASNQIRPVANRGGIVSQTTILSFTYPITFSAGEIRIGPTWNRYGDPQPIGDDWPNVLAHELAHYALFLEDTYLGLHASGVLIPIDTCTGTAMSDPYSAGASELRYSDSTWPTQCGQTLAELPDWDLITLAYPALHSPPPLNAGPTAMPFAFTHVSVEDAPSHTSPLLNDFNIPLGDAASELVNGRAYLRHPGESLIDLGRPILNSVLAHGARLGDELCVFGDRSFTCGPLSNSLTPQFITNTLWQPEILLTPINTATLRILVNAPGSSTLTATLYPGGATPQTQVLTSGVPQTLTLSQPAVEVLVDLIGEGPGKRLITGYTAGSGPGRKHDHGGPGRKHDHGGPFASGDGSLLLYPPVNMPDDVFMVLQAATLLPELPEGLAAIGRAYHVRSSETVTSFAGASLSFQYLGIDVLLADVSGTPREKEESLAVHKWDGANWTRMDTVLNLTQNFASAALPGPGLYVLTAGRVAPTLSSVSPSSGESGQTHTLTIAGKDFLQPVAASLKTQSGATYSLAATLINSQTVLADTPATLGADLYDLELVNAGGMTTTLEGAFALYSTQPNACFFDDFASDWGKWTRSGEWGIVTLEGQEAASDSPGASYLNADPGLTRTTAITSQLFSLPAGSNPVLSFRHDYVIAKGISHQDWGLVEVSFDGGVTWLLLASYSGGGGYPAALATTDEWSQIDWKTVSIDLTQAGMPVNVTTARVRFRLEVDALGSDKGWVIDDISVTASGCPRPRTYVYLPLIIK